MKEHSSLALDYRAVHSDSTQQILDTRSVLEVREWSDFLPHFICGWVYIVFSGGSLRNSLTCQRSVVSAEAIASAVASGSISLPGSRPRLFRGTQYAGSPLSPVMDPHPLCGVCRRHKAGLPGDLQGRVARDSAHRRGGCGGANARSSRASSGCLKCRPTAVVVALASQRSSSQSTFSTMTSVQEG